MVKYSPEGFYQLLSEMGFQETGKKTPGGTTSLWLNPKGDPVSVPDPSTHPDFILDKFLAFAQKLYAEECTEQRHYVAMPVGGPAASGNIIEIEKLKKR